MSIRDGQPWRDLTFSPAALPGAMAGLLVSAFGIIVCEWLIGWQMA